MPVMVEITTRSGYRLRGELAIPERETFFSHLKNTGTLHFIPEGGDRVLLPRWAIRNVRIMIATEAGDFRVPENSTVYDHTREQVALELRQIEETMRKHLMVHLETHWVGAADARAIALRAVIEHVDGLLKQIEEI